MPGMLTSDQIRKAEQHTLRTRPIAALQLMELAATAFTGVFMNRYPRREATISVYCGTGNNGGDGLAIARQLADHGYLSVKIYITRFGNRETAEFAANLVRARERGLSIAELQPGQAIGAPPDLVIDALLGSGLNRRLEGPWNALVLALNALPCDVISVDLPSGLPGEGPVPTDAIVVQSRLTVCFHQPRINLFLPDSGRFTHEFAAVDIGLNTDFPAARETGFYLITAENIRGLLKARSPFSHKGSFGHTLVVAGAPQTLGAAILCAGASVYAGSGLTTASIPASGLPAMNVSHPEVMVAVRKHDRTGFKKTATATVVGPGLGVNADTRRLVLSLLASQSNLVLDADALTLLAQDTVRAGDLPEQTVLTPHVKEFDRLFGDHPNWWKRLETARAQADALRVCIVLKNRYTFIIAPDEPIFINPTGAPALATGGSGDVLAGMLGALLSQGYSAADACKIGVFLHGWCGEQAPGMVLPPSDLIRQLPAAFKEFTR